MEAPESLGAYLNGVDEAYRRLPLLYLAFLSIWFASACSWTINTYKNRHFQTSKLQWVLASVPLIKALQLTLAFLFWYSCFNLQVCSLWMSFGVYVTGVLFQTACFVSFLLISHGYCIICERLSLSERRTTAALGCALYLTLVGHRASIPYFSVLLAFSYFVLFYLIFHRISQNLLILQEQLTVIEDEDVHLMQDAIYTKYIMFKKFRVAMKVLAVAEIVIYMNTNNSLDNYWLRLSVREWGLFCFFLYIGWTFRSQDLAPRFSVMPTLKSQGKAVVPPIYSIEMDAATFKYFSSHEWHIGLPTYPSCGKNLKDSVLVIIQHPHTCRTNSVNTTSRSPTDVANSAPGVHSGSFPNSQGKKTTSRME
ncbi:hypothetical protein NMG60_11005060 [Bertholletia excelsa]